MITFKGRHTPQSSFDAVKATAKVITDNTGASYSLESGIDWHPPLRQGKLSY